MNQSHFNYESGQPPSANGGNQFSYDHYDQEIEPQAGSGGIGAKLKSPIVVTGALLLVGVALAGIFMGGERDDGNVPVVQADAGSYKTLPEERGGAQIPYQDSTVFSSLRNPNQPEAAPVENLLAGEAPVDRIKTFKAEKTEERQAINLIEEATGVETAAVEEETVSPQELIQKIEPPEKPRTIYKPGSSPETIEFVKNVLEQDQAESAPQSPASEAAQLQPAAGHPADVSVTPGTHYIQLGSVKSENGAAGEWSKLQKKFPEIAGLDYRVQRADLGERGVFYRIQAGPISGESASDICGTIKAKSPGACLVTK